MTVKSDLSDDLKNAFECDEILSHLEVQTAQTKNDFHSKLMLPLCSTQYAVMQTTVKKTFLKILMRGEFVPFEGYPDKVRNIIENSTKYNDFRGEFILQNKKSTFEYRIKLGVLDHVVIEKHEKKNGSFMLKEKKSYLWLGSEQELCTLRKFWIRFEVKQSYLPLKNAEISKLIDHRISEIEKIERQNWERPN